jgi:hypothetical protein
MRSDLGHVGASLKWSVSLAVVVLTLACTAGQGRLAAAPINPIVFKRQFEDAKKKAEVVAEVRVLAATCTAAANDENGNRAVTLQLSLQVLNAEKGPAKKNQVVLVTRQVTKSSRPGPAAYGFMAALRQFPLTPGVKGDVALRWDKEKRCYVGVAGWVPEPNEATIPTEVGKSYVAGDESEPK